jgi:murein DD-endopeptidase MepM/ murein hydrolase activator NlpD
MGGSVNKIELKAESSKESPLHPPLKKGGWGDFLIFELSALSFRLFRFPYFGRLKSPLPALCFLLLCIFASSLLSCATSYDKRGRYHKVMSGDTIQTVARAYGVRVQDLAELNNIEDSHDIEVGVKLYLPEKRKKGAFKKLPFGKVLEEGKETKKQRTRHRPQVAEDEEDAPIKVDHGRFVWPVKGPLISPFGIRHGRRHDGVDLEAHEGDPVKSAGKGKVVFSGQMRGYGNLVIIRHKDDFFTVYAHNSKNLVNKGDDVKEGALIAKVGRTGRATGPHLHFEVRNGQKARNPIFFLPHRDEDMRGLAKR